jgi:uncharacterized protein YrzB (UPF0473 family)
MKKMEERDNYIVLKDEDGNEVEFEYLDTVDLNDKEYIVLLPLQGDESEEGEVVILEVKVSENGEIEEYLPVENDKELDEVFEEFKERMKDEFDFVDEN